MALNLQFQEQIAETVFDERATPLEKWKTFDDEHEDDLSGGFECNICLDLVHDPVVTFCGHLYCWPCIYKWIQFQSIPSENPDQQQPQCPVCKAEISHKTLIPLYGRGSQATKPSEDEVPSKSMVIPQRPPSPRCGGHTLIPTTNSHPSQQLHHQSNQQQSQSHQSYPASLDGATRNLLHPMIGEMVYAPVFGSASPMYTYPNSYHQAGSSSLRMRRQLLHADRSLGRVYFFLLCCVVACLLLF